MTIPFDPNSKYVVLWVRPNGAYLRTDSTYGEFVASQMENGLQQLRRPPGLPANAVFENGPYDTPLVPPA